MRQIVSVKKGGGPCRTDCPYYSEEGWVKGVLGVPLKTHCRATMEAICVDCDVYNTQTVEKMEVSEAEWKAMQAAIGRKAMKERKPYDPDHEEIHPVGYNWKHDRWKAEKSGLVQKGLK